MEIAFPIAPVKLFKAFVLDADNLIPKILPQAIKSVEILEGDGGPGTIKFTTFGEENFTYSYTIIDGDALMGTLETISYEVKILPSPDGGSICKTAAYHKG
ncbi:hypothetical protein Acr_22g0008470 [Actinidia rufa]|uniref:Bet v I/Major latex protein domain-containing protein n=1 Tax=Actinidia rufa TaxID=165716 RepID=A0A7J0GKV0_9ERIC|nr:hypothetical protein Acr_22g0008470 [Actinidia rufa]